MIKDSSLLLVLRLLLHQHNQLATCCPHPSPLLDLNALQVLYHGWGCIGWLASCRAPQSAALPAYQAQNMSDRSSVAAWCRSQAQQMQRCPCCVRGSPLPQAAQPARLQYTKPWTQSPSLQATWRPGACGLHRHALLSHLLA